MTWNYRLCKTTYTDDLISEVNYEIREVYYNKAGGIWGVSENPSGVYGDTIEQIMSVMNKMSDAVKKEIVDLDTLKFDKPDSDEHDITEIFEDAVCSLKEKKQKK
jgi:hypothetical protein